MGEGLEFQYRIRRPGGTWQPSDLIEVNDISEFLTEFTDCFMDDLENMEGKDEDEGN